MDAALEKARNFLKDAKKQQNAVGDNAEAVAEAAAKAIRQFAEAGRKETLVEKSEMEEATKLLNEAFKNSKDAKNTKSLSDFVEKHFHDGKAMAEEADNPAKTKTADQQTEKYTLAACEYQMAAAAQLRKAQIEAEDAAAATRNARSLDSLKAKTDAFDKHAGAGDSYNLAGSLYKEAAINYVYAADKEGTSDRELAEKKLEYLIALDLMKMAAKAYVDAGSEHKEGDRSDHDDKTASAECETLKTYYKEQADK